MTTTTTIVQTEEMNRPNWRQVGLYLLFAFGLSWGLNLILALSSGYGGNLQTGLLLQAQMLMPAFSAMLLGWLFFRNHPLYKDRSIGRARWFVILYLVFTGLFTLLALLSVILPAQAAVLSGVAGGLNMLGLILLVAIRAISKPEDFAKAGLKGGKAWHWLLYGGFVVVFYGLQIWLESLFGLGQPVDVAQLMTQFGAAQAPMSPDLFRFLMAFNTILAGAFLGLLMGFGEEYGWRSYLQSELIKLGRVKGILLLGLIWSVWHFPVILMGHNYPGEPLWGMVLMTGYTIALAFLLGYVMLKTGSIWLVAFLHAINNQTLSYYRLLVYRPDSVIWSFGPGVFGVLSVLLLALLVVWLDPVWREQDEETSNQVMSPEAMP